MVLSLSCSVFLGAWVPRIVEANSCIRTSARPFFNLIRSSQPSAHLLQTVFISKFFLGSALSSVERMHSLRTLLNPPRSSEVWRSFYSLTTCSLLRFPFSARYGPPTTCYETVLLSKTPTSTVTVVEWEGAYPGLLNSMWDLSPAAFKLDINDQKI